MGGKGKNSFDNQYKQEVEDRIVFLIKRREDLLDLRPICPKCKETRRIRLEEYIFIRPAKWRCMACMDVWAFEPIKNEGP